MGDTIQGVVTVDNIKPTSQRGRAVVTSTIEVYNQLDTLVMTYTAVRLLAGRPD